MQNRRNLYRLLHVQRDAPTAVIKGSYRTLMQTLRKHPDLGGDEWDARLLNEAREILCDPQARARYDATLASSPNERSTSANGSGERGGLSGSRAMSATETAALPGVQALPRNAGPHCHYCRAGISASPTHHPAYDTPDQCYRCGAPTRPARPTSTNSSDIERRSLHRIVNSSRIAMLRHWPDNVTTNATLLEFSTTGCALLSDIGVPDGDVALLRTSMFTATGTVRSSLPVDHGAQHRIGIVFLSVKMHASLGAIFSAWV